MKYVQNNEKKNKKKTTTPERSHSNIFVLVESNALLLKYLQKLRDVYKRIEKKIFLTSLSIII